MQDSQTIIEKIWNNHLVQSTDGGSDLLYIDLHLVHEVTSPQAFESMTLSGRKVRRPELTIATVDHNVPTVGRDQPWEDPLSVQQVETLRQNCKEFGIPLFDVDDSRQGIVHVIGPEQGLTQPGLTIVCGDSHTSTHGALGALAFGIGTSEVEHVLATQTLPQARQKTMAVEVSGKLLPGVGAKDVILNIINMIGVGGGAGYIIEYQGEVIRDLSMAGRMTICNMTIEAGARAGLIAPDDVTFSFLEGRPYVGEDIEPCVTWGTNPAQSVPVSGSIPDPMDAATPAERDQIQRSLTYMDLLPGTAIEDIALDRIFIGSCTNSRIEDLRDAAQVVQGKTISKNIRAMVVPGSGLVKNQAEEEGLDRIFTDAGFEWRDAGCSMCLGMNPDILFPGERCASTSNRNFEGRQGPGGRTHLVSPPMAAAAALAGHFVDIRTLS